MDVKCGYLFNNYPYPIKLYMKHNYEKQRLTKEICD